jgi:hypothetical protein
LDPYPEPNPLIKGADPDSYQKVTVPNTGCNAETPLTSVVIFYAETTFAIVAHPADFRLMDLGDRLRNEGLKFYDTLLHQTDQTIVQVNKSTVKINGKTGFLNSQSS